MQNLKWFAYRATMFMSTVAMAFVIVGAKRW